MRILDILSETTFTPGQELAARLGVSRAAVHKQVVALRRRGYGIAAARGKGYLLTARPDSVLPDEVYRWVPAGAAWPVSLRYEERTVSTQALARAAADGGVPEGTVIIAERQTGGYGRRRRAWASPPGGLWFSLVLRPRITPDAVAPLAMVCGLSLRRAVERSCGVRSMVKWPNDLMVNGRKCAGIITEMAAEVGRVSWVVLGVGVNVNNRLPDALARTAVSVSAAAGGPVRRAPLLGAFLSAFADDYRRYCTEGFTPFLQEYAAASYLDGATVTVERDGSLAQGTVHGIDRDGALLLGHDGGLERIVAGTIVRLRRAR